MIKISTNVFIQIGVHIKKSWITSTYIKYEWLNKKISYYKIFIPIRIIYVSGYGARVQLSQEELDRELDSYVKKRKEIAQAKTKSESDSKESGNGVAEPEPSEPKDPLAEPKDPLAEQAEPAKEGMPDENPEPKEPVSATVWPDLINGPFSRSLPLE